MKSNNKIIGNKGEKLVAKKYKKLGFKKISNNYSSKVGEIDLIFFKKNKYIFVEVKTRSDLTFTVPEFSVNYKKRKKIIKTAEIFLLENKINIKKFNLRFDVAIVNNQTDDIEIFENAFDYKGDII